MSKLLFLWFCLVTPQGHAFSPVRICPTLFPTTRTNLRNPFPINNALCTNSSQRQREIRHSTSLSAMSVSIISSKVVGAGLARFKTISSKVAGAGLSRFKGIHIRAPFRKANLPSILTSSQEIIALFQSIKGSAFQGFRRDKRLTTILLLSLICTSIYLAVDTILAKRRQRIDATCEWGRYADHPSVRGRALFGLMGRIGFMLLTARIVNSVLPGGEHFLFRRNKNEDSRKEEKVQSIDLSTRTWAALKAGNIRRRAGEIFAEGLLRLGPLYIKIGQILSCRKNLLPNEWKESMERLQDRVPAKSGQEAMSLAYSTYDGGEDEFKSIFASFDDVPLAAASLGQVHTATLKSNNKTVAIKLQRPRLREIYEKDLALMNKISKVVDKLGEVGEVGGVKQSWEEIFGDAEEILYREIDYRDEAENAMKFASDFGLGENGAAIRSTAKSLDGKILPSAASWLRTPYVYHEISNEKALVMEYLPSIKISDHESLAIEGVTMEEKEHLAECLARSYLRQFCCGKFFSTDPHAGNLGVQVQKDRDGKKKSIKLVFYDFGQACTLQDDQASGILNVIEGIMDYDVEKCVSAFQTMGVLSDVADLDKVRRKVKNNFETGKLKVKQRKNQKGTVGSNQTVLASKANSTKSVKSNRHSLVVKGSTTNAQNLTQVQDSSMESGHKEEEINDAEIMSYFTLPAEYAFVARALSQMDGVGKNLDGDFDFISGAAPFLVEIKGSERYLTDELTKYASNLQKSSLDWQKKLFRGLGFRPIQSKE